MSEDLSDLDAIIAELAEYTNLLYDGRECPGCGGSSEWVACVSCFMGDKAGLYPRVAFTLCPACAARLESGEGHAEITARCNRTITEWCIKRGHVINRG